MKIILRTFSIIALSGMILFLVAFIKLPLPPNDFIGYWAVGRSVILEKNPYDPQSLYEIEREGGWMEDYPLIMFTPPWSVPLFIPFGFLPFTQSQMLWYLFQCVIFLSSVLWYWTIIQGYQKHFWIAILISLFFWPSLYALQLTQITPLMLLGSVIFLVNMTRDQYTWKTDMIAGFGASLLSVKPHAVYLFWLALLIWSINKRRLFVLSGLAIGMGIGSGITIILDPNIFVDYLKMMSHESPTDFNNMPTIGYWLRLIFGKSNFLLLYVSVFIGFIWFIWWWKRNYQRNTWENIYEAVFPMSLLTTIYTWSFDQVVLLPMILKNCALILEKRKLIIGIVWFMVMIIDLILHRILLENYSIWRIPFIVFMNAWINHAPGSREKILHD